MRTHGVGVSPWQAGFAIYRADCLVWWRSWSLRPQPHRRWVRERLSIVNRTEIVGTEIVGTEIPGLWLVHCRYDDSTLDLTMSDGAYAGFSSWLESAPPNRRYPVV